MGGLAQELKTLQSMTAPTTNAVTDRFGIYRHWGSPWWNPYRRYAPVHSGRDYRAVPDPDLRMPVAGQVWGDYSANPDIGTYCMILPTGCKNCAVYFYHAEPTPDAWSPFEKGESLTTHAGYGIGEDHLHLEVAVTAALGQAMMDAGLLEPFEDWRAEVEQRAMESGIPVTPTIERVEKQMAGWGIREIGRNYLVRGGMPRERQSRLSDVGGGETWIIDPGVFLGG